ncbi:MAG: class I SAM-dependent methyltransferase [Candidatus Omnitrophica bacterium]|nr:class I SAM-dependent methyltransferase [Candidatus Omnitrophota bacterium]
MRSSFSNFMMIEYLSSLRKRGSKTFDSRIRAIALILCIVLPLTEITPAFAKSDSGIPLRAAFGSSADPEALARMQEFKFRLNQTFIRGRLLQEFSREEIEQIASSGFGAGRDDRQLTDAKLEEIFFAAQVVRYQGFLVKTRRGLFLPTAREEMYDLLKMLPIPADRPVTFLDAGHGQGEWAILVAHRFPNVRVIGIESDSKRYRQSRSVLQAAVRRGFVKDGQVTFLNGNFNHKKFSGYFRLADFVYYYNLGTNDLDAFGGTLRGNLKPGARVVQYGKSDELKLQLMRQGERLFVEGRLDKWPGYFKVFTRTGFGVAAELTFEHVKGEWELAKEGQTLLVTENYDETEAALFSMPANMRHLIFRGVRNVIVVRPDMSARALRLAREIARLLKVPLDDAYGLADYDVLREEDNIMLLRQELFHFGREEHLPPMIRHLRSPKYAAIADWLVWVARQHKAVRISA